MPILRAALLCCFVLVFLCVVLPVQRLLKRMGGWPQPALIRLFCRGVLWFIRCDLVVQGVASEGDGRLLVANHVSWIDALALGSTETLCFLAKKEVSTWPLIGGFARSQETVFVDRAKRRLIPDVNRAMASRLLTVQSVLLFPEATTHDGSRLGKFHTSHLACLRDAMDLAPEVSAMAVQSVSIHYSNPAAAWTGDATLLPHLWLMMRQRGMRCQLSYGSQRLVIRGFDRKALGRELAAEIEESLVHSRNLDFSVAALDQCLPIVENSPWRTRSANPSANVATGSSPN